jgi:hypothetical protein
MGYVAKRLQQANHGHLITQVSHCLLKAMA